MTKQDEGEDEEYSLLMKSMKNTMKMKRKTSERTRQRQRMDRTQKSDQTSREKQHYIYKNIDHTGTKKTKTQ